MSVFVLVTVFLTPTVKVLLTVAETLIAPSATNGIPILPVVSTPDPTDVELPHVSSVDSVYLKTSK